MKLLRAIVAYPGRYFHAPRHHRRRQVAAPAWRAALGERIGSIGIQQPGEPSDADDVTAVVVVPAGALTIASDDGGCDSGYIPVAGKGVYECELELGHDSDHSACGGDITWPRKAEMAVA